MDDTGRITRDKVSNLRYPYIKVVEGEEYSAQS